MDPNYSIYIASLKEAFKKTLLLKEIIKSQTLENRLVGLWNFANTNTDYLVKPEFQRNSEILT